jgi:hypothetical protein
MRRGWFGIAGWSGSRDGVVNLLVRRQPRCVLVRTKRSDLPPLLMTSA